MIVCVIGGVLALLLIYILAAKFFCQDSMASIPFSGINSKFAGKLQSTSSIKTLDSDEGPNKKATKASSGKLRK